jgi:hypothetical protein
MMYTMIFGLKTVVWCIANFRSTQTKRGACLAAAPRPATSAHSVAAELGLDPEECEMVAQFLENGLRCFRIHIEAPSTPGGPGSLSQGSTVFPGSVTGSSASGSGAAGGRNERMQEENNTLEHFARCGARTQATSWRSHGAHWQRVHRAGRAELPRRV